MRPGLVLNLGGTALHLHFEEVECPLVHTVGRIDNPSYVVNALADFGDALHQLVRCCFVADFGEVRTLLESPQPVRVRIGLCRAAAQLAILAGVARHLAARHCLGED